MNKRDAKTIQINERYEVIPPVADTDEMAEKGRRLMFRHNTRLCQLEVFIAPKGEMNSGWVIGLFSD